MEVSKEELIDLILARRKRELEEYTRTLERELGDDQLLDEYKKEYPTHQIAFTACTKFMITG